MDTNTFSHPTTKANKMNQPQNPNSNQNTFQNGMTHNEGDFTNNNGKTRQSKGTKQNHNSSMNPQKNLNEWLENCLKDPPALMVSSDYLTSSNASLNSSNNRSSYAMPQLRSYMSPVVPEFQQRQYPNSPFLNLYRIPNILENSDQEFQSLPPIINMGNNGDQLDASGTDDLINPEFNPNRRFSDPCLVGNSDDSKNSGKTHNITKNDDVPENSKLISSLMDQIHLLHETNSKICRNLHETKVEIEALKHAPSWGLRNRRDSVSGMSTHSQPLNYGLGTHSPAPTYHSGMYTPGMLTDVVREVRDAARIREEALLNRVKSLVDERSWALNDTNFRIMKELEEMKSQMLQFKGYKKESHMKIAKLEDEVKHLKMLLGHSTNPFVSTPVNYRQNRPQSVDGYKMKRHSMNLSYGTVSQDNDFNYHSLNDDNLSIGEGSPTRNHIIHEEVAPTTDKNELGKLEQDKVDLRRELQTALDSNKQAESRILALETMVTTLTHRIPPPPSPSKSADTSPRVNGISNLSVSRSKSPKMLSPKTGKTATTQKKSTGMCLTGPITDL